MNYLRFAFRNLRKKGIRSWLTLLGIFIGILAVISLITLGNALKLAVTSQFGASSTEVITIQAGGLQYGAPGSLVTNPLTTDDVDAINRLGSVEFAVGINIETGKLEYNDVLGVGSAYSIPEGDEKKIYEIFGDIEAEYGRLLETGDYRKVFLGNNFYNGETNGFKKDIFPGKKILLNDEEFEVVGILKKKGSFLYDWTVFMYDDELKELAGYGDTVDLISAKVKDKSMIDRAEEEINKLMRQRRDVEIGEEDFSVTTPEAALEMVNSVLGAIQVFIVIIAMLSIFVGSIGIVNTMTTSVLERRKEIGIMKSIGATNFQIFLQFFIESGFLGLIGGILGALAGTLIGYIGTLLINNWIGSSARFQLNFPLIFLTLFGSFLIGAVAGIIPAIQASKQNPVEALRG
jgi:putative ABC transport system permease protein